QAQAQTQPTPAPAQAQHQPLQKQQKQHHQQQYVQPGAVQYMVCFVPADPTGASGLGGYGMGGYGMGGMHQMTMGMPMVQMGANAGWGAPAGQQQVYWGQQSQPSQPSQPAEQGGKDEAKSWADPSARPFTPSGMQDASALSFTGQAASWREGPRGKDGGRRQEQQQSWRRPEADESWRKGGGKGGGGKGAQPEARAEPAPQPFEAGPGDFPTLGTPTAAGPGADAAQEKEKETPAQSTPKWGPRKDPPPPAAAQAAPRPAAAQVAPPAPAVVQAPAPAPGPQPVAAVPPRAEQPPAEPSAWAPQQA
ncbi:unnamed protein product, partial [Prorocentrum cordatum]